MMRIPESVKHVVVLGLGAVAYGAAKYFGVEDTAVKGFAGVIAVSALGQIALDFIPIDEKVKEAMRNILADALLFGSGGVAAWLADEVFLKQQK